MAALPYLCDADLLYFQSAHIAKLFQLVKAKHKGITVLTRCKLYFKTPPVYSTQLLASQNSPFLIHQYLVNQDILVSRNVNQHQINNLFVRAELVALDVVNVTGEFFIDRQLLESYGVLGAPIAVYWLNTWAESKTTLMIQIEAINDRVKALVFLPCSLAFTAC